MPKKMSNDELYLSLLYRKNKKLQVRIDRLTLEQTTILQKLEKLGSPVKQKKLIAIKK